MKVLLVLNHAPDYRESFLQELSSKVKLTVAAQTCKPDGLTPPVIRGGYEYIEIPSYGFFGFRFQPKLSRFINFKEYDIICCNLNPRQPQWIAYFFYHKILWKKWVWWGRIYGSTQSNFLDTIRRHALSRSSGSLVYSEPIADMIKRQFIARAISFNNTEVQGSEFRLGQFGEHKEFHLLFVGRCQPRKKLERLVALASRRDDIYIRLVGPGMENVFVPPALFDSGRVSLFGKMIGQELNPHFDWADIVTNPGHVGLLVMNAARHGKGIIIDSESSHAPEYWLAKEAEQPFIPFGNPDETDRFFDNLIKNRDLLKKWGNQLQEVAKKKYTVEYMAETHYKMFKSVAARASKND